MPQRTHDVVMIGDFRFPGGVSSGLVQQIRAQAAAGYRTGLIQIKAPVLKYPHPFNPAVRACLDEGLAELLDPEEPVSAPLALAFHPQIFTHRPNRALKVKAERKLLVVCHPLVDGTGRPYYDWRSIDDNAQEALSGNIQWAPVGPLVREPVPALPDAPPLHETDWLEVLDVDAWAAPRRGFRAERPVIGRHSRPDPLKWPDDPESVLAAYPDDPACIVRILGGGDFLTDLIGPAPANWEVLPFKARDPKAFLETLDFFVYFHHSTWVEAFGRVILEAVASGALAILPEHFRVLFAAAAVYGDVADVKGLVGRYYADRGAFEEQTRAAQEIARERFSHTAHVRRLANLIGSPRRTASAVRAPEPAPKRRVLFVTSNGIGMGHLTRMLAVARRCPPGIEPVFATMSQAMRVLHDQGYLAEYIPFHAYLRGDMTSWNYFLRHEINELLHFYGASVLVFDGNVAYGGLVGALRDNPWCHSVWCRRALWRPGAGTEENIRREADFDAVIEPGEIAGAYDAGLTTLYRDRTRVVDPMRLLDESDLLTRSRARHELELDPARPAVLIQLGSGNNYDFQDVRDTVIDRLREEDRMQVVVAEWLIAHEPAPLPEGVRRLSAYPNARYLQAFDFAVSAAGYNGFHELLLAGVPAIFVPNENPMMDEQLTRAQYAERHGLGLCLRTGDAYRAGTRIERMLDPAFRKAVRKRCRGLKFGNGAEETARFIEELVYAVRADRAPRGYWSKE